MSELSPEYLLAQCEAQNRGLVREYDSAQKRWNAEKETITADNARLTKERDEARDFSIEEAAQKIERLQWGAGYSNDRIRSLLAAELRALKSRPSPSDKLLAVVKEAIELCQDNAVGLAGEAVIDLIAPLQAAVDGYLKAAGAGKP